MTEPLLAYHNDPLIKAKYLMRIQKHMDADDLIRSVGWYDEKGGAVGCTVEAYDHSKYPIELGIPEWLAHVEDTLFEGMSLEKSKTWPRDFLDAISPGDDLNRVKVPFLIVVLTSALGMQESNTNFDEFKFPEVKLRIEQSKQSLRTVIGLLKRNDVSQEEWDAADAARDAAWSAARDAADAAWAAARNTAASAAAAARARNAAVRDAAAAAKNAAWSADVAAVRDTFNYFADELIRIIKENVVLDTLEKEVTP